VALLAIITAFLAAQKHGEHSTTARWVGARGEIGTTGTFENRPKENQGFQDFLGLKIVQMAVQSAKTG
jgi:hypothetical protein